ncbi:Asp-tRNA(Asn)/Glu-tRNA(Gln) amidotransferase subunit GatB [uncultured Finegoldia sp.]|uniref:Asp-tRNA(Asn)/Glu-tRNA(Gln) amidotransferase subunit GatB n=1 Tax=uncultured Finegoldia sp. TaxID=328009 RepID=UPI00262D7DF2|nr:Asp-tRNA(Asn)/Glu-tRNA(Gln) amidotransferase subunit GatB [uncultured Finegoldia sp.]
MNLKTLIGLEIHVELSTKTKMFCGCKNEFGQIPNTNVCPICLGHPGALPNMNKEALRFAIMAGLAFDCDIANKFKMDRKKYFYPDLVKGYQITQQDQPLCTNGYIELKSSTKNKKVRIRRIHIEEDTGKSIHNESGNTLMDYNRAGVPLIEIVSEPDMSTPEEAREFLETLRERIKYLKISDVKMSEGSLRCDVNINVYDEDSDFKTKISEIKNLNSFKSVSKALVYEQERHIKLAKENKIGEKETRRWDEDTQTTIVMRHKEEGNDYRFSVEGDIPNTYIEQSYIDHIKEDLPELPEMRKERFIRDYKIDEYDADILTRNGYLADYYEKVVEISKDAVQSANWLLGDVLRQVNENEIEVEEMNMDAENLAKLIKLSSSKKINNQTAKKILREMFNENFDPEVYVKEKGLLQVDDDNLLQQIVDEVVEENPESIESIRNGKDRAIGFLVGQCMKKSKGKGNPQKFNELIKKKI